MNSVTVYTHCPINEAEAAVIHGNDRCPVCSGTFLNRDVTVRVLSPGHKVICHSACLDASLGYNNPQDGHSGRTHLFNRAINTSESLFPDHLLHNKAGVGETVYGLHPLNKALGLAIINGNKELLLSARLTPEELSSAFTVAVRRNDRDMAEFLLAYQGEGGSIAQEVLNENLREKIRLHSVFMVQFLFSHGATLPRETLDQALSDAIRACAPSMAEVLLKYGATCPQEEMNEALRTEIRFHGEPMVQLLFSSGASLPQKELDQALSVAIRTRALSMAKLLLKQGATCPKEELNKALKAEISRNGVAMVEFLLAQGSSLTLEEMYEAQSTVPKPVNRKLDKLLNTERARLYEERINHLEAQMSRVISDCQSLLTE